ncbi:AzlD domain-containing protein [Miniphocaeibacter massiliensis]|uniref:AzlD domain-containing protein n=1 Tax=Miniphocaeibacter massiliensis TaxID=2041841 RepID=UPI0013EB29D4|nr:AzlD domain-containing protein [Miniphocaeibacter massiliensis]
MNNIYIYILIMATVTYLIRAIPLTLIRKQIKNNFIKSFLYYVPFVTLSVIIFPDILYTTNSIFASITAFIIGIILSVKNLNMIITSVCMCLIVYILDFIIPII